MRGYLGFSSKGKRQGVRELERGGKRGRMRKEEREKQQGEGLR